LTKIQAEAIGLPLIQEITYGEKEKELEDLKRALKLSEKRFKIEGVVTGAIRSIYQASRIQSICLALDLWCFNPLWLKDPVELLNELIENGFKVVISGVFAFPLDRTFLGEIIDSDVIKKLEEFREKYALNPAGEGGEMETTVLDAPFFKKRIEILDYEIFCQNNSGVFKIKNLRLIDK
ncbi:MAG: diphthine--ammonia ligase, partial [Candidatus Bathyarchaeia archaeon]